MNNQRNFILTLDEFSNTIDNYVAVVNKFTTKYKEVENEYTTNRNLPVVLNKYAKNLLNFAKKLGVNEETVVNENYKNLFLGDVDALQPHDALRVDVVEARVIALRRKVLSKLKDMGMPKVGLNTSLNKYINSKINEQDPILKKEKVIELLQTLLLSYNIVKTLEPFIYKEEERVEQYYEGGGGKGVKGKKKSQPQILKPRRNSNSQTNKELKSAKSLASKSKPPKK
tara:strand:- start:105 stop:785 length:681 start_codon:yes stop_codon:yes gene_type:complete